jgi:predicted nucleic acid-binding protein
VRASTKLKLPDAYAVATAIRAGDGSGGDVRLETFDKKVIKAYADLLSKTA